MTTFPFNIAFIGPVSAGKSTLMNAILSDTYSDMRLRRTTMSPQVYSECQNFDIGSTPQYIRAANKDINQQILDQRNDGQNVDINEVDYNIKPVCGFLPIKQGLYLKLYDIPGLNDQGSEIYFEYMQKNIEKFDLIFLVFDIKSGLNRTDELHVLKTVLELVKLTKTHVVIVANKSDEMSICNDEVTFDDEELSELFDQFKTTILKNAQDVTTNISIVPLSAELLYIYRTFGKCELDDKYIDKLAYNEIGRVKWNRKCKDIPKADIREHKLKYARELLNNINPKESINCTGFNLMISKIKNIVTDSYQQTLIVDKWIKNSQPSLSQPTIESFADFITQAEHILTYAPDQLYRITNFVNNIRDAIVGLDPYPTMRYIQQIYQFYDMFSTFKVFAHLSEHWQQYSQNKCIQYLNCILENHLTCHIDLTKWNSLKTRVPHIMSLIETHLSNPTNIRVDYNQDISKQLQFLADVKTHFADKYKDIYLNYYYAYLTTSPSDECYKLETIEIMWSSYKIDTAYESQIKVLVTLKPNYTHNNSKYTFSNCISNAILSEFFVTKCCNH